jgi:hypothetical protein
MKFKTAKLSTIILIGIGLTGLRAQETVTASGGDATGSGGSASYTVGQVVYTTNTGTNGSVAQGVQQPYEYSTVTSTEEAAGINLNCITYPNPVNDNLTLRVDAATLQNLESLSYHLYDIDGKLLETRSVVNSSTDISMGTFVPGTYILTVTNNNNAIKTFKIIKN